MFYYFHFPPFKKPAPRIEYRAVHRLFLRLNTWRKKPFKTVPFSQHFCQIFRIFIILEHH